MFLPFENRPNQNAIIKNTKLISKSNLVNAYYHRLPEPLQTEMLYKKNEIDNLYVSAKIQKEVFIKFFNWPQKKIKRISSLRYNNIKLRKNIIYLPYEINDIEFYLKNLEFLNKNDLPLTKKFSVSVHPLKLKSKDHLILRDIIKKFINRSSVKNNSNISIILGETGSVASECLETHGAVYHITNYNFNIFSSYIWKNIKIIKIKDGIYLYKKKSSLKMVDIGVKKAVRNFSLLFKH